MHDCPHILICDAESQWLAANIKIALNTAKYRLQTAGSLQQALASIQSEAPDLVILDVMMPGFEALDTLDYAPFGPAVIVLAGESSLDLAIKAIGKGAVDYLRKPFHADELGIRMSNVLKLRRMRHEQLWVEAENRQLENRLRQSRKLPPINVPPTNMPAGSILVGGGTLPRPEAVLVAEAEVAETVGFDRRQAPGGHEHILIVDDEEMLVYTMGLALEQLGYQVTAFTNGAAAHQAFIENPYGYDLLVADMSMPGITGAGLVKAVKQVRDLPIILCLGCNEQISMESAQALGIHALVMKPVGTHQLARTIRNVLVPLASERRKSPRFRAPAGAYVFLQSRPQQWFKLLDIGMRGLAYRHNQDAGEAGREDKLALMIPGSEFSIDGIKCQNVADLQLDEPAAGALCEFRRGVCFEGLNMLQMELLTRFIHSHATELLH